jgi:LysR family hydrogen peroxide-inducible transcriptional activator
MDIKQLQALVAIADHGSFSAAATALATVQSNVSSRIARLETELDTDLVNRSSGTLTESGEVVVRRARRILHEVTAIGSDVGALDADIHGDVALGLIGTTGRWLIPQLLEAQRSHLPFVRLRIAEGTNSSLEPRLAQGHLDLAVLSHPVQSAELHDSELFTEDLLLVLARDHELAQSTDALTMADVAQLDLLLPLPGTTIRIELDDAARAFGVRLRSLLEIDGMRTLASLVFDGYGPAILPATALPTHLRGQFVARPIDGLPPRHVALCVRRFGFPSASVRAMRQLLFAVVAETTSLPRGVHPLVTATSR